MANDNIFQQYLTPPKSMMEYSAEMDQADVRRQALRQNALELAAGQQKYADYQREREGENHLSRLLSAGGTPDQVAAGLAQAGYGKQALAYTKQQQDLAKAKADAEHLAAQTGKLKGETGKIEYDQREAKRQKAITDIAAFTDPQQAAASLKLHIEAGDIDPAQGQMIMQTIPQNPDDFPKWQIGMLRRIMSAKESAGQTAPDANTVANNERIKSEGQKNRDQAERHFRAAQEGTKGQIVQTDSGPVLVNTRTGTGKLVTGADGQALPGVTKPLNDSQSKALLFGTRMQEAHKVLNQLATEGTTTSVIGSRLPLVGGVINAMSSGNNQMLDQAKRDFMTALLRRESGAAISSGEYDNADKQYFPQIGDSKEVIKQKARNRELAIAGVLNEVPAKQRGAITPAAPQVTPAAPQVPADIDALLKKHGGK
jgi:hypothetical protein